MRDLSILVSTPTVMVAMITMFWLVVSPLTDEGELTQANYHCTLDIVRDE
jgi:hypothetical protein